MIRIAGINKNDMVNGEGVSVSLFLQGCPFHCPGCHNPETWDPAGGTEHTENSVIKQIVDAISANGIQRNLSILGGEPLDTQEKINFLNSLIKEIKNYYPTIKIIIWTGYLYNYLKNKKELEYILNNIDYLIEGPFKIEERDITLKWRGSRNQNIINTRTGEIING